MDLPGPISKSSSATAADIAAALATAKTLLIHSIFGDGRDGCVIYSDANARWEDANGTALASVGGKWTVSGATLTLIRDFDFDAHPSSGYSIDTGLGGILQLGSNSTGIYPLIRGLGKCKVRNGGRITAGTSSVAVTNATGGAARTTAGAGNTAAGGVNGPQARMGRAGGGGSGGGDGMNNGGSGRVDSGNIAAGTGNPFVYNSATSTTTAGTGAGTNGTAPVALAGDALSYWTCPRYPGTRGFGGGGGALKNTAGSSASGAGGDGGLGGGVVDMRMYDGFEIDAGGKIDTDGRDATNGTNAVSDTAGNIAGGGGGGAGGGAGLVALLYGQDGGYVNNGTVSSAGGLGGGKGLGYKDNGTLDPAHDGGTGPNGGAGKVITHEWRSAA